MTNIFLVIALIAAIASTPQSLAQSPSSAEVMQLQRDLDSALAPLKTLNEKQMLAVAGLVRATQLDIDIIEYCPPLRQFDVPKPIRCFDQVVSYAFASKECKKARPTWKDCPKLLEAEAAWASCEFSNFQLLRGDLGNLGLIAKPSR